jgi:RNA polymerase sigma-70 factor (ECF subfamily)
LNELDRSLTLLLLDGFSYKEMADALGMSETNVGVRIHRIKAYLTAQSMKESKHAT